MKDISGVLDIIKQQGMAEYCDGNMALIDSFDRLGDLENVNADALFMVLCLSGSTTVNMDGREFDIGAGDLMVCLPGVPIGSCKSASDIECRCICLSMDCVNHLSQINFGDAWNAIVSLHNSPVIHLLPDEIMAFCNYYDLILSRLNRSPHRYHEKLVETLLMAFLYDFHGMLERFFVPVEKPYRSAGKVFRDFVNLLSSVYPRPRDVTYYADKLCLTSKHLSTVCKQVSGLTASKLITRFVVKDIKYLLDRTDKSIKEICNELDFPNPSFFGTYVKKNIGMSPGQYRERDK